MASVWQRSSNLRIVLHFVAGTTSAVPVFAVCQDPRRFVEPAFSWWRVPRSRICSLCYTRGGQLTLLGRAESGCMRLQAEADWKQLEETLLPLLELLGGAAEGS